eukprot:CAMPEP_0197843974 /NCGR_PEP_ID=MMETSP1438-20131217/951_1 /TAXON_ID=1461541 /ORGANISM="Pterosperma sp., Strain CCMP1384" /LENGTH=114 /DNA_ID=CAMNT_0043454481 /DNA_START=137 /DNA_END=477 /DNA_ORIENTATION=+
MKLPVVLLLGFLVGAVRSMDVKDIEAFCEGHGFNEVECMTKGCCQYDDGECWANDQKQCIVRDMKVGDIEAFCEGHGFNEAECMSKGCCEYDDGECWANAGKQCIGEGHGFNEV